MPPSPSPSPPPPPLPTQTPIPLLLLKSPSTPDPYTASFPAPRYSPQHIPPLSTTPHLATLLATLSRAPPFPHAALLFTSVRAVRALALALRSPLLPARAKAALAALRVPLFAVGAETAAALREHVLVQVDDEENGAARGLAGCWVEGEEAGTGEVLAGAVGGALGPGNSVLWVAGETRREMVGTGLRAAGVELEVCVAYGTAVDEGFGARFADALRETESVEGVRWVVLFSGQGAAEVLIGLGWLDERSRKVRREHVGRGTFVACIGPTTREYLETEFGLRVDVCAERPSAEGMKGAIERFMKEKGIGNQE